MPVSPVYPLPPVDLASGIASLIFGEAEVQAAIAIRLRGLAGRQASAFIKGMAEHALGQVPGRWALAIGLGTLIAKLSGAFAALHRALNAISKRAARPSRQPK